MDEAPATPEPEPADPERIWCDLRGVNVDTAECASSCVAPEHRPVCWLGKMWRDEGGSD